ncbi:MAG: Hsp20/alpha crystallin family protein [Leptolyngbyaceae cyanobacterium MO_188.B28]|nr:Hsp20/alpha crystallin family protein [Leptolyngbyaceae cyanobacterium MO_188.B28]
MIVRYWNPIREADLVRRQIDQIFDGLTDFSDAIKTTWTPAINLVDQGNNFILKVQLPGITANDIDVQVTREAVIISGDRKEVAPESGQTVLYSDVRYGPFRRVVSLPEAIQNSQVAADFDQGVLTITLPKVEEVQNKVVKINLADPGKVVEPAADVADAVDQGADTDAA